MGEESWERNRGRGMKKEETWKRKHEKGIMGPLGRIWKRLEDIWESGGLGGICSIWKVAGGISAIWKASVRHLGNIWKASGRHLGHLGSKCEASGGHLGRH